MQKYARIKLLTRNAIGNASISYSISLFYIVYDLKFELIEKISILGLIHWNFNITRVLMQKYARIKLLTRNAIGNASISDSISLFYIVYDLKFRTN